MAMLIAGPAARLTKIGAGKLLVASPFIFAGAYAGSNIAAMTQTFKGPQDPNRAMASTANASFAALPGAAVGVGTMVAAKKLAQAGSVTRFAGPAKYAAAILTVTGAGATLGALGAGGILQPPLDFARGLVEKQVWSAARSAMPFLPETAPKFDLTVDIPSLMHDMTSITTRTNEEYSVHLKEGEKLDPMKIVHHRDDAKVLEMTEKPGVDGGTTFSQFNDRINPAPKSDDADAHAPAAK